jgi:LacI family transcriptional regulator, gluconate utilization system Gnt-I transcriptional repressor
MQNPSHLEVVASSGRRHGRATLADVARQAGVTIMTVSRYLSQRAKVAEPTALKIKQAIADTGYTPNLQALSLASGRSQVVAVIVPNMAQSIFADTLHGLGAGLQEAGLHMLISSTGYALEQEHEQLKAVLGWAPAGIVVTGRKHLPETLALLRTAQQRGTPVIEIWDQANTGESAEFVQIGFNHHRAGEQMAQALMTQTAGELIYIDSGVAQDSRAHERAAGFMAACRQAGRAAQLHQASDIEPVQAGRQLMVAWLETAKPQRATTAFAFANDLLACGALFAAQHSNLSIPQDLRLLGFGDFSLGRHVNVQSTSVGLSTMRIDGEQIGRLCAEYLAGKSHQQKPQETTSLEPTLVLRSS